MKELSRQINSYLMELDDCTNTRAEFEIILKIEQFIQEERAKLCFNEEGESYFYNASNLMMQDIAEYLNDYKERHNCPGKDFYEITFLISKKRNSTKIMLRQISRDKIRLNGLGSRIDSFPKYTLSIILGLDVILGEDYIKHTHYLIKEEYDKFMRLRQANPIYFYPFIQDILHNMELVEVK